MIASAQPNPPRASPDVAARCAFDSRTGAAANVFGVKTAAAAAGPEVVTTTARSGRPEALIPAASPPARKPDGMAARRSTGGRSGEDAGMGRSEWWSWRERQLVEAGRLGQAVDEVERLDRLARGALDEVVLDADRQDPAGPLVERDVDPDVVRARDVLGRGRRGDDRDERLVARRPPRTARRARPG